MQELSAKVATWESELAAERAEKRSRSETAHWRAAMQTQVTHLTKLTAQQEQEHAALERLIERQEQVLVPWWVRWIREEWRALILPLLAGLLLGGGGMLLYQRFGPPAQELRTYRGMWEAMTGAEQVRINQRLRGEDTDQ